jgi:hypothetical protein
MTTRPSAGRAGVAPSLSLHHCRLCGATLQSAPELAEHVNRNHAEAVQEAITKLSAHAQRWALWEIEASGPLGD